MVTLEKDLRPVSREARNAALFDAGETFRAIEIAQPDTNPPSQRFDRTFLSPHSSSSSSDSTRCSIDSRIPRAATIVTNAIRFL